MAHSLRRSLYKAAGLSSSFSRRCFSQIPPLRAGPQAPQVNRPRQVADRSMRVASKEMQAMPSDIGIFESTAPLLSVLIIATSNTIPPVTFITSTGRNLPSLFGAPLTHLKYQWKRLLYRFRDQLSLFALKYSSPKEKSWFKRSIKLSRSTIMPTAVALHRQMYTSFAEGDAATLRKICTDGIYDSFRSRIGNRARGEKVVWELVKYNQRSKLISNRAMRLPIEGAAFRQAVVRIASRQKLTRWVKAKGGEMQVAPGSGKERDVVEYVVVQRQYERWEEGEWRIWGTTKETTLDDVEEWERRALQ